MKIEAENFTPSSPAFHPACLPFECRNRRKEGVVMFILSVLMHPAGLVLVAMLVIGHVLTRALLGGD